MKILIKQIFIHFIYYMTLALAVLCTVRSHEAKDFDDTILYKIDFEIPDFKEQLEDPKNQLRTFYTHDLEKYDCLIPTVEDTKEESNRNEQELSPLTILKPIMHTFSYRIEAYWSYEVCHGSHVRQYHEEREGKTVKFQEYYLGKWSAEKTEQLQKEWEENHKAGIKYKTTKIDSINYPYFEMVHSDGTMCDIINAPRTTVVRYVCYPHGKNDIYSFKETSSCNYEVIILTSSLCVLNTFHPEESKEISIKCFNSPTESHKPLSMLRQELHELQVSEQDFPVPKEMAFLDGLGDRSILLNKIGSDVDKLVLKIMATTGSDTGMHDSNSEELSILKPLAAPSATPIVLDVTPILDFISGKNCLTGGSGWWKYEFCYGHYVRQFHKEKKSETELFLGYFFPQLHQEWLKSNPHKLYQEKSSSIWYHYEKGSRCDRTGQPREIDVKLTCSVSTSTNPTAISMYLLEPKTCKYILVFESPMVCVLLNYVDKYGLIDEDSLKRLKDASRDITSDDIAENKLAANKNDINKKEDLAESPAEWTAQERIEL